MSLPRLLLVEDEFLIRLTLAEALSEDGFDIVEAEHAEMALERLAEAGPFDAMLTDIQLPGRLDGRALARLAREQRPDLPVLFMSGRPEIDPSPHPRDTYVNKPYSPAMVSATLRRILDAG